MRGMRERLSGRALRSTFEEIQECGKRRAKTKRISYSWWLSSLRPALFKRKPLPPIFKPNAKLQKLNALAVYQYFEGGADVPGSRLTGISGGGARSFRNAVNAQNWLQPGRSNHIREASVRTALSHTAYRLSVAAKQLATLSHDCFESNMKQTICQVRTSQRNEELHDDASFAGGFSRYVIYFDCQKSHHAQIQKK